MNIKETEVGCVDRIRLIQNSAEQQTLADIAHQPPTYTIKYTQFKYNYTSSIYCAWNFL